MVDRISANAAESLSSAHLPRLLRELWAYAECDCWGCRALCRDSLDFTKLIIRRIKSTNFLLSWDFGVRQFKIKCHAETLSSQHFFSECSAVSAFYSVSASIKPYFLHLYSSLEMLIFYLFVFFWASIWSSLYLCVSTSHCLLPYNRVMCHYGPCGHFIYSYTPPLPSPHLSTYPPVYLQVVCIATAGWSLVIVCYHTIESCATMVPVVTSYTAIHLLYLVPTYPHSFLPFYTCKESLDRDNLILFWCRNKNQCSVTIELRVVAVIVDCLTQWSPDGDHNAAMPNHGHLCLEL